MKDESQQNIEKQVYVEALRKAAQDYEELVGELSVLKLLNDSLQAGLGFNDICNKLVQFVTETMNVENASIMVMDHEKGGLRLLVAKNFFEEEGALFANQQWEGKIFKLGEGVAGQAAKERKSVLVNDTSRDSRFVADQGQKVSVQSILCLPLIHGERLHGVLNLSNSQVGAFDSRKEHALNIIASTASVALSHALALEELQQLNKELTNRNRALGAVIALSESLHANLDVDAVLAESLQNILEAFDIDATAVFLKNEKTEAMELKSYKGRTANPDLTPLLQSYSNRFSHEIVKSREPVSCLGPFREQSGKTDHSLLLTCIGVPLFSGEDCFGMLMTVGPSEREPGKAEIKLLVSFCNQISLAIHNSILVSRLKENIRELQETKHKLIQADKLALLGEMLSSVAHEINNPLAAIMGYSELLLGEKSLSEHHQTMLKRILLCVDRSRKIVQGLLSFARKTELKKEPLRINATIDKVLEHRDYDFAVNNVEIMKDYEPHDPIAIADPNQIEQVFLNLINNAFDAMVGRDVPGRLQIKTRLVDDSTAQIEFTDNGRGIRECDRAKVFEPFFTTKEVGKGTGLGLSVSYGIIKEHGGNLYLDEHYLGGARFTITLPVVRAGQAIEEAPMEEPGEVPKARGRILVVDDEEVVTDIVRVALSSEGFAVECASDGEMACRMLASDDYDLIISDIRMPGTMDGRRLYSKINKENPALAKRFVFITGDIMEKQTAQFLKECRRSFLLKPFSIKDLRRVVSKSLRELIA